MQSPLSKDVALYCSPLLENGAFSKVEDEYEPSHFGDALVTLGSVELIIRFLSDRGDIFCEVGSAMPGHKTWDIALVVGLINEVKDSETQPASSVPQVAEFATLLLLHLETLRRLFSPESVATTESRLKTLAEGRSSSQMQNQD
jgi:hypothetical protein